MSTIASSTTLQAFSKRIVHEGVLTGPRPRVPSVTTSLTYQATSDLFLAAVPFVAADMDEAAMSVRVRRAVQDTATPVTGRLVPATFQPIGETGGSTNNPVLDIDYAEFEFKKLSLSVFVDAAMSRTKLRDSVLEADIALARASLLWSLGDALVNGDGSTNYVDAIVGLRGFTTLSTYPQYDLSFSSSASLTGQDPERTLLREVLRLVSRATTSAPNGNSTAPDALVTSDRVIRRLVDSQHGLGVSPEFRSCPLVGGLNCYCLYGVPVLPAPVDDTSNFANLYAVKLTGPAGLRVVHLDGRSEDRGVTVEKLSTDVSSGGIGAIVQGYHALVPPESHSVVALTGIDINSTDFPV
jgi:hypothetical protein